MTTVNLSAAETLWLDGAAGASVRNVTLTAAKLGDPALLPASLDQLSIHLTHGTDRDVATLLSNVTHLRSLSLRGTTVTDAIIPVLERYDLSSLDLVGTATTAPALARFRASHPEVGLYPRTPPFLAADVTVLESPYDQLWSPHMPPTGRYPAWRQLMGAGGLADRVTPEMFSWPWQTGPDWLAKVIRAAAAVRE